LAGAEGETKETGNGFLIRTWGLIPADLMGLLQDLKERTYTEIFSMTWAMEEIKTETIQTAI
jgi:hypothetical protein